MSHSTNYVLQQLPCFQREHCVCHAKPWRLWTVLIICAYLSLTFIHFAYIFSIIPSFNHNPISVSPRLIFAQSFLHSITIPLVFHLGLYWILYCFTQLSLKINFMIHFNPNTATLFFQQSELSYNTHRFHGCLSQK